MRQKLLRVGTAFGAAAAIACGLAAGALAAPGHGVFKGRLSGVRGGPLFGPQAGPGGLLGGGFGAGGGFPGRAFGFGGPGMPGVGGAGGLLGADVLTPASTYLGISLTTLETDLAGGKTLADEATAKGKTASGLIDAIVANEKTILDADKAAGWITADQETALTGALTKAITALVNGGPQVPPGGGAVRGGLLQTASTYLGISVSDLQADLKSGKSLADVIGTVSGKTVDGLVAALEAPAKSNLDAAVTAGKITQAQETAILGNLTTRLTDLINNTKAGLGQAGVMKSLERYAAKHVFAKRQG